MTALRQFLRFLAISAAFAAGSTAALAAINIAVDPANRVISLGSATDAAISIDGLGTGSAPSVGAFDITVGYNPSILSFVSASFGDPSLGDQLDLSHLGTYVTVTPGAGSVNLFELSFDSAADLNSFQASTFRLVTLKFMGSGVGVSPISLNLNSLADADGVGLATNLASGSISVTAVPEPSEALMLLAGLAILGCWRRPLAALRKPNPVQGS
jgi:hypothetical protein